MATDQRVCQRITCGQCPPWGFSAPGADNARGRAAVQPALPD